MADQAEVSTRAANYWSKDENKVGQKILEKMGWKKGQGIGLNSQGITHNIKLVLKSDAAGLGYRRKQDDQWTVASDNFCQLLSQLTANYEIGAVTTSQSLQQRSQKSKSRVHYRKFAKGKDVLEYKQDDLQCIFGAASDLYPREDKPIDGSEIADKNEALSGDKSDDTYYGDEYESAIHDVHNHDCDDNHDLQSDNHQEQIEVGQSEEPPKCGSKKKKRKRTLSIPEDGTKMIEETKNPGTVACHEEDDILLMNNEHVAGKTQKTKKVKKEKRRQDCDADENDTSERECEKEGTMEEISKPSKHMPEQNFKNDFDKLNALFNKTDEFLNKKVGGQLDSIQEVIKSFENKVEELSKAKKEGSKKKPGQNLPFDEIDVSRLSVSRRLGEKFSREERVTFRSHVLKEIEDNKVKLQFRGSNISVIEGYLPDSR